MQFASQVDDGGGGGLEIAQIGRRNLWTVPYQQKMFLHFFDIEASNAVCHLSLSYVNYYLSVLSSTIPKGILISRGHVINSTVQRLTLEIFQTFSGCTTCVSYLIFSGY